MVSDDDLGERSLWDDPRLQAGAIRPAGYVAPWLIACYVVAAIPGSTIGWVAWGLWIVPLAAISSFVVTVVRAARLDAPQRERVVVVLLGLLGSGVALAIGVRTWFAIAEIACHGGYECPF